MYFEYTKNKQLIIETLPDYVEMLHVANNITLMKENIFILYILDKLGF